MIETRREEANRAYETGFQDGVDAEQRSSPLKDLLSVDPALIGFAVAHIQMLVAENHGMYHDQPTLAEDLKKLADDGYMPKGWYELKEIYDKHTKGGDEK
jgi:hypothetical protein